MIETSTEIAPAKKKKKLCPHPRSAQPVKKWIFFFFFGGGGGRQFGDADQKYCNAVMHELYKLDALEELHQPPFLVGNLPIFGHTYYNHKIGWKMDQIPGHDWFFSMSTISTFLDSQKNTTVLRYYVYLMDFLQKNATSTYKKTSKLEVSKIWRVARKSNPPIFYMSVFLKHHLFSYWFIIIQKGRHPLFFTCFFFPFPWEYLYIYIYMFRNLPPWKPFTNLITNPSPTASIPIHPGELPDLQAHPHDNTRRAWLQGLDWSCPGEPIRGGDPGVCGPCCCFLFAPQKKGWRFCWKPGNPHQKKEKKVGTFMEENPENNWMFHSCYVGNGPGYKHVKPAQASYTNSIPRSRLESGCWLTHQRSMVDKAIPARRPKIRVHQPERDWKCVKMIRNCFWIQRTLDLASRHMRATWLLSYRYI